MSIIELFLLAIGLSMDAFAVSVCAGLTLPKANMKKALIIGVYFGVFQAIMPVIGYMVAKLFAEKIIAYDHWVAVVLLIYLGGRMAIGSFKKDGCPDRECPETLCEDRECPGGKKPDRTETSISPAHMIPLALATSVDALAVGVSFAFLRVDIIPAVLFIGVTTLVISIAGVEIGRVFGTRFKSKAELAGGIILILVGLKILLEHLDIM